VAVLIFLFVILFYLQSVQVHSGNCVKMYTVASRRGLSSGLLYFYVLMFSLHVSI
jgi:hypothetical protein